MKLLDKLTNKLTNLLLDYIRRKNGRGRICRFLGVDDKFMTSLTLDDLRFNRLKYACIPEYGPIVVIEYSYLEEILHLYNLIHYIHDQSKPERCEYCIFGGDYKTCNALDLLVVDYPYPCSFRNEDGENKQVIFMSPVSLIKLRQSCKVKINQSLFIISYIRYNTACLSVKR